MSVYSGPKGQVPSVDAQEAIRQVIQNGVPYWQSQSGRTFPQVAGAEDPPPANTDPDQDADQVSADDFDKDRALRKIQAQAADLKRRREANDVLKAQLTELDAIKAKLKAHEDAKLSETERLQARLEELEKAKAEHERERQTWRDERAIGDAARTLNARNPAVVVKLVDASKLERNAEGEPTNAEDLVKDLLKKEAYLVGTASSGTGVPASPRSNGQPQGHDDRVKEKREILRASGGYEL